mmetsp:Transcript_44342/g.117617  ORF Transcript_44342/g.117617 Transcript_44342/m.117617 type:complete len:235 (+) Transcript_44342:430-1134(+)
MAGGTFTQGVHEPAPLAHARRTLGARFLVFQHHVVTVLVQTVVQFVHLLKVLLDFPVLPPTLLQFLFQVLLLLFSVAHLSLQLHNFHIDLRPEVPCQLQPLVTSHASHPAQHHRLEQYASLVASHTCDNAEGLVTLPVLQVFQLQHVRCCEFAVSLFLPPVRHPSLEASLLENVLLFTAHPSDHRHGSEPVGVLQFLQLCLGTFQCGLVQLILFGLLENPSPVLEARLDEDVLV